MKIKSKLASLIPKQDSLRVADVGSIPVAKQLYEAGLVSVGLALSAVQDVLAAAEQKVEDEYVRITDVKRS